MGIRDKAAKISFSALDEPSAPVVPAGAVSPASGEAGPEVPGSGAPSQRVRSGVAAITQTIGRQQRIQELEAQVAQFEDATLVVELDPRQVQQSKWRNRHELSFATKAFADLKAEIAEAGKNVQPIKVRRLDSETGGERYEIVYGRRRLRACLELGLPVRALVQTMSDVELFTEMERENRNRADLSPWEQGVMYRDALDGGLFPSQRRLAEHLGLSQGNLSVALKLANLPAEIVSAFDSPLNLQYRWANELTQAFDKDPARVLATAAEIAAADVKPSAKEVFRRLVAGGGAAPEVTKRELLNGGKVVGLFEKNPKGGLSVTVRPGVLSAAAEKKLIDFLERLVG